MPSYLTRRQQARMSNLLIDQALLEMSAEHRQQVIRLTASDALLRLAERIRKRAGLLAKQSCCETKAILQARDELILHLYASAVPQGWSCGWSDGSSVRDNSHYQAGVGGIVMDSDGNIIERISRGIGDKSAFDAELTAVVAVMYSALERKQTRLVVYTDNKGIVQLWAEQRADERLHDIRQLGKRFERFSLRSLPRLHNQPANALAKQAVQVDER
jgi:ribonuclease HI